ncbi:hypothetical protein ES319_D08G083400v1 [Gossypium barbadense]|uniref:Uncharacterized protein n=2 Tax=Gossypium TaxID=3633 RepID=A0A5J5QHJ7_GOSBA
MSLLAMHHSYIDGVGTSFISLKHVIWGEEVYKNPYLLPHHLFISGVVILLLCYHCSFFSSPLDFASFPFFFVQVYSQGPLMDNEAVQRKVDVVEEYVKMSSHVSSF